MNTAVASVPPTDQGSSSFLVITVSVRSGPNWSVVTGNNRPILLKKSVCPNCLIIDW